MKRLDAPKKQRGFTLIELMIVIAIVGILVSISMPQFVAHQKRACNSAAKSDIKKAHTAALAYFCEYPEGNISGIILDAYGYKSTVGVNVDILNSTCSGLSMTSKHTGGDVIYTIDSTGNITP